MRITTGLIASVMIALFGLVVPHAGTAATLNGEQFNVTYYLPDLSTPYPGATTATNPVTAPGTVNINVEDVLNIAVTISANKVSFEYSQTVPYTNNGWNSNSFSGIVVDLLTTSDFEDLGFTGFNDKFSNFFVDGTYINNPGSGGTPASPAVTLSGNRLAINWQNLDYDSNLASGEVILTPVPAAIFLFGPALAGLGVMGWRGRKRA